MVTSLILDARNPEGAVIARAVDALRAGAIVAYCTDTFYGFAVDPRSGPAVAELFAVKGRAGDQAVPLIAADAAQVLSVARMNERARRLAARFWPGPLTLVLPAIGSLAEGVAAADGSVAIRVPDHAVARALAAAFAHSISATSANRSGLPPAETAEEAAAALGDTAALVLDSGRAPGGPPSTIVDARDRAPRLIRGGAVAWDRVLESLQ